jgi:hypothetical protein
MKKPGHLSPSGLNLYLQDRDAFYWKYLSVLNLPEEPQTQAMSIGSAFDARVKSFIHSSLFGANHPDANKFDFQTIFESQVAPQHRDWALSHSAYVFEQYKQSGALNDLMLNLERGHGQRFEFEVKGIVHGKREGIEEDIFGVTLLGRPDASYINSHGAHVVLDWKVNGYCSKYPTSPKPGYLKLRQAGGVIGKMHKDVHPMLHNGMIINAAACLESVDEQWARQLCIYSWLLGEAIGGDQLFEIHQIVAKPGPNLPQLRIAEHRMLCTSFWQLALFTKIIDIWEIITSDWYFREMSPEQSRLRCELLDQRATNALEGRDSELFQILRGL